MSPDPFLETSASYALGSLEEGDRLAFEGHLRAGCEECAAAVGDLLPVLGLLAQGAISSPGAAIRSLLMDLAEAPRLPLDLCSYAWEETDPGVRRAIVRRDPERNMVGALLWGRPGARYPSHRHHGDESLLVLQGRCRDEVAEYGVGSVARKGPGSVHEVEFLGSEDCIGYVVSYGGHERVE
jgi:anti-sigma factor ChrR (cupin superfamily)